MLSDKLLSLLSTFSKSQLNGFNKYLSSPIFNENKDLNRLFNLINSHFEKSRKNGSEVKHLEKKEVWKRLYPSKEFVDVQIRRLCSDLTKTAHGFLAYTQFKNNPAARANLFAFSNQQSCFRQAFYRCCQANKRNAKKAGYRDDDFHYNTFLIEQSCHKHLELVKKKPDSLENLENADYHLDCFYITKKLKNYCDFLGYKNFLSFDTQVQLFPSFLDLIKDSHFRKEASVNAYYLVAQMLRNPDDESFAESLKQLLYEDSDKFSPEEIKLLYIHLKNYYITIKINAGLYEYYNNLFEIFKMQIDQGKYFRQ